ncbi:uncharacterized protein LOC116337577 [Contarinia nasturtii]|uniref:uncharacterized protein LOC116337577 n=1 Tax=Contarinia nasturtii TaxID=265458 RepID=UPI0012D4C365|nr:uncharacterized protein LOC116337577 [Contarinia nasturtii]
MIKQLVFDDALSVEFLFLNANHQNLPHEYPEINQLQPFERKPVRWISLKYPLENREIAKAWTLRQNINESRTNALNKTWPIKFGSEIDRKSEIQHLENHVNSFNLADIKLLRRVLISDITFTRQSTADYIIHKLNRIEAILSIVFDCFEILNISFIKYMFVIMLGSMTTGLLYVCGKFSYDKMKETGVIVCRIGDITSHSIILNKLLEISRKLYARHPYWEWELLF